MTEEKSEATKRLERGVPIAFQLEEARDIMWEILKFAGVYQANTGEDEFKRGVIEGQRRVGLFLEQLLAAVPTKDTAQWRVDSSTRDYYEMLVERGDRDEMPKKEDPTDVGSPNDSFFHET